MRLKNSKEEIRALCLFMIVGNLFLEYLSWSNPTWLYPSNYTELNDYVLSATGYSDNWLLFVSILATISLMSYISLIGLMFFKNWARWLFVAVFFLELLVLPFTGIGISTGGVDLIGWLITIAQTVILVYLFQEKSISYFK